MSLSVEDLTHVARQNPREAIELIAGRVADSAGYFVSALVVCCTRPANQANTEQLARARHTTPTREGARDAWARRNSGARTTQSSTRR